MRTSRLLLPLALLALVTRLHAQPNGFGGFQQQQKAETSAEWHDINYADDGQAYHTLDIYLPKKAQKRYPVVVHIYGSAWFSNNGKNAADLGTIVRTLLDSGYAVVCPNHRSSTDAQWPAQLHDIRAVVRFIRARARDYKFDTRFIATSGFSSGGHLSSVMATTSGMKTASVGTVDIDLEGAVGTHLDQPSTINAACDWSGPVDLTAMDCGDHMRMGDRSPEDILLNSRLADEPDKYRSASATTYASTNPVHVPIIIFHGEQDNVVPCCQGKSFLALLQARGYRTEGHFPTDGGHGMGMYDDTTLPLMARFLDSVRKKK